jgi:hypothetical protein
MPLIGRCLAVTDEPKPGQSTYFASYMLQEPEFRCLQPRAVLTNFPLQFTAHKENPVRILGGFGVRLGDTILGLQAAHVFRKYVSPEVKYHCYIVNDPRYSFAEAYDLFDGMTHEFFPLIAQNPVIHADFCDLFYRPEFNQLTLQDFFFDLMGMDWQTIPDADKAPVWLQEKIQPATDWRDTIWLVPHSSDPMRCFSPELIEEILKLNGAIKVMPRCRTLREFLEKIAGCRGLISTDTSAYHIAAAWNKPSCVVFDRVHIVQDGYEQTSAVPASRRACYYLHVRAIEFPESATEAMRDKKIFETIKEWLKDI